MTFINLRKRDPKPELDAAEPDEAATEVGGQEQEPDGTSLGLLPALYRGVQGWCAWCGGRIGVGPTWGLHVASLYAAGRYSGWVTFGVVGAFVLVVGWFTPREPFDRLAARVEAYDAARTAPQEGAGGPVSDSEEAPAETGEEAAQELLQDPLVRVMWDLIESAPGVHLKTLTERLVQAAEKEGTTPPSKADVEAALVARKIRIRKSVRDVREKVNRGVYADDLRAWQQALPSPETAPPAEGP